MKHLFFSVALVSTMLGFGQASGNLNYQNRGRNSISNSDFSVDFPSNYDMVVSAKGLANIKADAFVAIFSITQTGKTAEEATSLMSQRLSPVLSALKAKNMEAFVDMISFVPMYEFETEKKVFSKRTYNEVPVGFELKQNLHIKSFLGTSQNAVEIQIWTALITILLLQYLKRIAKHPWCLSNLTASLRLNTFTKIDLFQWINKPFSPPPDEPEIA